MNDFTKEELYELYYAYEQRLNNGYVIEIELLNKLQSMIYNYCEHYPTKILCASKDGYIVQHCGKCGGIFM